MPEVAWEDIRANRILVAHIYHRIDYAIVWETLVPDVPRLAQELQHWLARGPENRGPQRAIERGPDLGL
jgi:uncharacterized protein with HEPN domain